MNGSFGSTIKTIAVIVCILGIIGSLIVGGTLVSESSYKNPTETVGWTIIIAGSVASFLGAILMYGFGELIEESSLNRTYLSDIKKELTEINRRFQKEEERRKEEIHKEEERKRTEEWERKKEELKREEEARIEECRRRAEDRRHREEEACLEEGKRKKEEARLKEELQGKEDEALPKETLCCPACGKKQPEGVKFCYSCGAKLK